MMVLGIDPGPKRNGWALLNFSIRSSPVWFDGGTFAHADRFFAELLGQGHVVDLVVVERAVALHNPLANVQAMGTAWAGGVAYGVALGLGLNVRALGVTQWRRALVGRFMPGEKVDARVDAVLWRTVRGMPARTNVHMRDAAGVACVGARAIPPRRTRPSEAVGK
jgi:Holliday junction resolvasome RuvABC endonuclease subunit